MPGLVDDLRFAARTFSKNKGFTAVAVLSLALGIGANATIFSLVDAVLLKPLPVARPESLVALYTRDDKNPGSLPLSYPNFLDLRGASRSFSALVAHRPVTLSLSAAGAEPEKIVGELVSGSYFETLGVRPALGRGFRPEEDGAPGAHPVAVLAHSFWQRRFGADPGVVGRDVVLNGTRFSIVGVAPSDFRGLNALSPPEVFLPLAMYEQAITARPLKFNERRALHLSAAGRLKPGTSLGQARSEIEVLSAALAREHPEANGGRSVALVPLVEATINPNLKGRYVLAGAVLMTVAGLVLLVACATVANLLLARAVSRRKEIAIRLSLGAARSRLVRQLLTESLLLALAGGAAGLLVAFWGRDLLWSLRPPFLPDSLDVPLDARVLGFTFGLSVATGVLFGLLPALQSSRPEMVTALKNQAAPPMRGRGLGALGARSLLVVAQVALSLVSLIGAALFVRSLIQAQRIDPGFEPQGLVTVSLDPGGRGYDAARGQELYRQVVEEVERLPGIRRAAMSELPVLQAGGFQRTLVLEGQEAGAEDRLLVRANAVGTGYFETLGIPLRRGRGFTPEDREGSRPVAVINETMARRFWPGRDPIGRRFGFFGQDREYEIVGIAADAKYAELGEETPPYVYLPLLQAYPPSATLYARASGDPGPALAAIRKRVRALDPGLPLTDAGPVSDAVDRALWGPRVAAGLLLLFGLLALALATMGLYGVISYAVQQGRRDIGIRVALGAAKGDVLGLVLRKGLTLIGLGLSLGLALGLAAAALLAPRLPALLVGTDPSDPAAWAGAAAVLALVGLAATWVPARRAAGIDPALVLRQE